MISSGLFLRSQGVPTPLGDVPGIPSNVECPTSNIKWGKAANREPLNLEPDNLSSYSFFNSKLETQNSKPCLNGVFVQALVTSHFDIYIPSKPLPPSADLSDLIEVLSPENSP